MALIKKLPPLEPPKLKAPLWELLRAVELAHKDIAEAFGVSVAAVGQWANGKTPLSPTFAVFITWLARVEVENLESFLRMSAKNRARLVGGPIADDWLAAAQRRHDYANDLLTQQELLNEERFPDAVWALKVWLQSPKAEEIRRGALPSTITEEGKRESRERATEIKKTNRAKATAR